MGERAAYSVVVPEPAQTGMPSDPLEPSGAAPGPDSDPRRPTLLRRFGAFLVDWVACSLFTFWVLPYDLVLEPGVQPAMFLGAPQSSWAILAVFAVENILLVSLTGSTIGHRLFGMQVWQVRPGSFPLQVVVRTLLLCLVVPAVISGRGGRGLHDVAAGTRIVLP